MPKGCIAAVLVTASLFLAADDTSAQSITLTSGFYNSQTSYVIWEGTFNAPTPNPNGVFVNAFWRPAGTSTWQAANFDYINGFFHGGAWYGTGSANYASYSNLAYNYDAVDVIAELQYWNNGWQYVTSQVLRVNKP